jgi:ribosomal protein S27AE
MASFYIPFPLSVVIYHILEATAAYYNVKMLALQLENADDKQPRVQVEKENLTIEQEIECPRCHDVMTLHSEFDRLGYLFEECDFSLHLTHRKYFTA